MKDKRVKRKVRKRKAGGKGKRKGSAFERKVCTKLSRWIDPNDTEIYFWRSAMSGGRATVQSKRGINNKNQVGDITCIHPKGEWLTKLCVIECKFYKDLDIKAGLLTGRGKFAKFWKTVRKLAKKHEMQPLLIANENFTKPLLVMTEEGYTSINTFRPLGNVAPLLRSRILKARIFDFEEVMKA